MNEINENNNVIKERAPSEGSESASNATRSAASNEARSEAKREASNEAWNKLADEVVRCARCRLCETRTNPVFGRGSRVADVLIVGEGPGEREDAEGKPFVGRAGKLLDLALLGLMFAPDDYYIANIVKCRPPKNRNPSDDEAEACVGFLRKQFLLLNPLIVVCLGAVASGRIIGKERPITQMRGQWVERKGRLFMPTFHPAALLRDPSKKESMWRDLLTVKEKLDSLRAR